jgi:hypothetical protein
MQLIKLHKKRNYNSVIIVKIYFNKRINKKVILTEATLHEIKMQLSISSSSNADFQGSKCRTLID